MDDNTTLILIFVFMFVVIVVSAVCVNAAAPSPSEENTLTVTTPSELVVRESIFYDVPLSDDLQLFTQQCCKEYGIEYELVLAIIQVESSFNPDAYNYNSNCYGLMQINRINLPEVMGVLMIKDIFDPCENILSGVYLLKRCFDYADSTEFALMIYNCGLTGARELRLRGITESNYINKVLEAKANLKIREKIYYWEVIEK